MTSALLRPQVFFRQPREQVVAQFLAAQCDCRLTYEQVGCTNEDPPPGFDLDQYRVRVGHGEDAFRVARKAICGWQMFPAQWTEVMHNPPIGVGQTVAVMIRVYGLWWLNSTRIVYVMDVPGRRYGFAYGTLPGHVECGEERFLVERDGNDDVWYELKAVSRPRSWLTRMGYPFVRRLQRRFARDSQHAMREAVAGSGVSRS